MHAIPRRLASAATVVAITFPGAGIGAAAAAAQSPEQIRQSVERELREDRALRELEVTVDGNEVTLAGPVRTFWEKNEALRRTFDVEGVETVASEIVVPTEEDHERLVEEVVKAIQRYPHYQVWDYIDGNIANGAVTIMGAVTPERDKARELFERIAKIRGVQDVQMQVTTLSPSSGDRRIRASIGRQLSANHHFQRFGMMKNPPFHIVVNNGVATLLGYVQGDIERMEMQRIVAQTQGVLRVDNQLQTVQ